MQCFPPYFWFISSAAKLKTFSFNLDGKISALEPNIKLLKIIMCFP